MIDRRSLAPEVQEAIGLFEAAPVGRQLHDPDETRGRCWRSATRFLAALRSAGADGHLRVWVGEGWSHGAICIGGSDVVVDWTAAQFEKDPAKAVAVPTPLIETIAEADKRLSYESYHFDFEGPFLRGRTDLPEVVLGWEQARERIPQRDAARLI